MDQNTIVFAKIEVIQLHPYIYIYIISKFPVKYCLYSLSLLRVQFIWLRDKEVCACPLCHKCKVKNNDSKTLILTLEETDLLCEISIHYQHKKDINNLVNVSYVKIEVSS